MKRRTLVSAALVLIAGAVAAAALSPATCRAAKPKVTGLSRSSARVGATLTIKGSYFGASQSGSTVTFGERKNRLGFAPCSKTAKVISWSRSSIRVRVPGMSPGKAGEPGTHHPVYVTVGGKASNRYDFYITPVKTVTGRHFSTSLSAGNCPGWSSDPKLSPYGRNTIFENCTFTCTATSMPGGDAGVLQLGKVNNANLTFLNCTINGSMADGSDEGANTVKIKHGWGTYCYDITFVGCTFGSSRRMAMESVGTTGAPRLAFIDCVFAPSGSECVSFGSEGDQYCLMDGCTIKGYNTLPSAYSGGWEANAARYIEVRDTTIWAGGAPTFNIGGLGNMSSRSDTAHSMFLYFNHVITDEDRIDPRQTRLETYSLFMMDAGRGMSGTRWDNCTFRLGTQAKHKTNGTGGPWGDVNHVSYNNFASSTITGVRSYDRLWYTTGTGNGWPINKTTM